MDSVHAYAGFVGQRVEGGLGTLPSSSGGDSGSGLQIGRGARKNLVWQSSTSTIQQSVKRFVDVIIAGSALLVLAPLLLVLTIVIRLDSKGPALFTQARWGKDKRPFKVLKFRTMRIELCDPTGVAQTVHRDPRITRVGAFLRRTNLDELPQLYNVFVGDMSLVGPRCHPIGMLAAGRPYEDLIPHYHLRHTMRPGLTGLAQVRGWRGPTVRPSEARARIMCDLYYIRKHSIRLDMQILVATLASEIAGGKGF